MLHFVTNHEQKCNSFETSRTKPFVFLAQEKMRVLKQREVFNLMHAIQQFENNTRIFYSLIRISKTG